jgi:hypothetical protein
MYVATLDFVSGYSSQSTHDVSVMDGGMITNCPSAIRTNVARNTFTPSGIIWGD